MWAAGLSPTTIADARDAEAAEAIVDLAGHRDYRLAVDVSSGGGHVVFALAALAASVCVTSASPAAVARCVNAARDGALANITACVATAERLPFRTGGVDLLTCRVSALHLHAARRSLDEAVRVLAPGGVFILADTANAADEWLGARGLAVTGHAEPASPMAWCRLLEEHGLTVDTTVATGRRPSTDAHAPGDGAGCAVHATPRPDAARLVRLPAQSRDHALIQFAWHGAVIRASRP